MTVRKCSHGGVIRSRFCASAKNANTSSRGRGSQSCDWKFRTRMKPNRFRTICSCFSKVRKPSSQFQLTLIMDSSPPYPPYPPFPPYPPYPPVVICCCHGGATYAPQPQQAGASAPPVGVSQPPATGGTAGGKQPGVKLPNPLDIVLGPAAGLAGGVASFAEDAAGVVGDVAGGIQDFLDSIF